jgi:hypothetical protein
MLNRSRGSFLGDGWIFCCLNFHYFVLSSAGSKQLRCSSLLKTCIPSPCIGVKREIHMSLKRNYRICEDKDVVATVKLWRKQFSDFIRIGTSQRAYGLPRAGTFDDCPYDEGVQGCSNYYFTIQDFTTHPTNSESSARLPELIWVGGLHGDEPLGTTVIMEAAALLLEAAACEAMPRRSASIAWHEELQEAKECRAKLLELGIDTERRQWLARLVSTRRIVIVPIANSLGFSRGEHDEGANDPDKDFPYAHGESGHCMQTITAKTVNGLFRDHMFQVALSFHGGERGVGYSWSNEMDVGIASPDQRAQDEVAKVFSSAIGGWPQYPSGQSNELFQYRNGSMEDWAFAASWDEKRVSRCSSANLVGNATNRAMSIRIGTGVESGNLGSVLDVFDESQIDAELSVARHVRVALHSAEFVQPYVSVFGINNLTFSDDIVPLVQTSKEDCQKAKSVAISRQAGAIIVEWAVGGAIEIEETELWYAKLADVSEDIWDCSKQPGMIHGFRRGGAFGSSAATRRHGKTPHSRISFAKNEKTLQPVFKAEIDVSNFTVGERLVVIAAAKVDQSWKHTPQEDHQPGVGPRSHLVNARTNPSWHHTNAGKIIDGRLIWYSNPVSILVEDFDSGIGAIEVSNRFSPHLDLFSTEDADWGKNRVVPTKDFFLLFLGVSALLLMVSFVVVKIRRQRAESAKAKTILQAEIREVTDYADYYFDESCPVQVFSNSYIYDYDDKGDENWEIIDFTT